MHRDWNQLMLILPFRHMCYTFFSNQLPLLSLVCPSTFNQHPFPTTGKSISFNQRESQHFHFLQRGNPFPVHNSLPFNGGIHFLQQGNQHFHFLQRGNPFPSTGKSTIPLLSTRKSNFNLRKRRSTAALPAPPPARWPFVW